MKVENVFMGKEFSLDKVFLINKKSFHLNENFSHVYTIQGLNQPLQFQFKLLL